MRNPSPPARGLPSRTIEIAMKHLQSKFYDRFGHGFRAIIRAWFGDTP
jgi:hypothetical protein